MKILEQNDTGSCTKFLKLEIPRDEVNTKLEDLYDEFTTHASVPGFRKGKASKKVVQMKYGRYLKDEAIGKAVEQAYQDAIDELDLKPVTQPDVKEIHKDNQDEPVVVELQFEYRPEIEVKNYKELTIEPPDQEVTEKDVVDTLNRIRENQAMFQTVEDRPAQKGDQVQISSNATLEGEPFPDATHDEISVELGSGRYIPGFEDAIEGMNVNDEKSITLTLPDDYPTEEHRGKEATFEIKVKQIQEKKLPELDDEFAKDMGPYENLDELKDRIRKDLEDRAVQQAEQDTERKIQEELLKQNEFDVPPSMVRARYNYINALQDMEYRRYGQTLETMAQHDEGLLARNEQTAEDEVKVSLILDAIAKEEGISVTDEDYMDYINNMAQQDNVDPSWLLQRIESQGMDEHYRRLVLEQKVLNMLKKELVPEKEQTTE